MQRERDAAVDHQRENRDPQHQPGLHFHGIAQAQHRFVDQPERNQRQQHSVDERRQDSGAVVAVGLLRRGRLGGPAHGQPGKHQRGNVGEVVHSVADQGDRVARVTGEEFDGDQSERRDDSGAQRKRHALGWQRYMRMAAQTVAVAVVVSMVVAVGVAIVRVSAGLLCFIVHQPDSNRDSVCLTAWIRARFSTS